MLENKKIVVLHNIIAPYKTLLFNALYDIFPDLKVLYISKTENRREWDIKTDELKFPHEIMFESPLDEVPAVSLFRYTWTSLNVLNPDVLIIDGYIYASSWAGLFWAKVNKRKVILWSSSNEDDHDRMFYKESVKKFFVKKCDAYNVYGTKSRAYLQKLGANSNKLTIVGNNTDNAFYYSETMKLRNDRAALCKKLNVPGKNFLYIGRFSSEKNILHLLDAYRRIAERNNKWGLILVGSGPQKKEIEDYTQKHRIKNVSLPGFKQKIDIPEYLALSDVFILPSRSEPWGIVVNEAMAAGLPVLVSKKCGCYPDLVKDGENGFAFDPFDKDELFNLMKKIVEGKTDIEEMGRRSLEIVSNFTPEKAAGIISGTIRCALNEV
ncbi:MAG: glycosyltransferase family 1 protein [Nitrospiraceae bacterium]|nr:MAG: glycosyltransferase family 1 protein [Nitrospiraceae bacterium]